MKKRVAIIIAVGAMWLAPCADAAQRASLSKTEAREWAFPFIKEVGDLLEVGPRNRVHMVPPRRCQRVSRLTVTCAFSVEYVSRSTPYHGIVRARLQPDGLVGLKLPDDWDDAQVPPDTVAQVAP